MAEVVVKYDTDFEDVLKNVHNFKFRQDSRMYVVEFESGNFAFVNADFVKYIGTREDLVGE